MPLCYMQYGDLRELCNNPKAKAAVLSDMDNIGREAQAIHLRIQFFFTYSYIHQLVTILEDAITDFRIKTFAAVERV